MNIHVSHLVPFLKGKTSTGTGNGNTYVLNDMAVIADEENRAAVWQVDLHAHQTVRVPWEVVQRDALAEVEAAFVEGLPVPVCA